jgi:chemotaxis protein histidine kinase CheA
VAASRGHGEKGGAQPVVRSAAEPGQTLNVDLCFVPATHKAEQKLPAVSGSSGRLVVERPKAEAEARDWPGRVFEDAKRDYAETMLEFVAAAQTKAEAPAAEITAEAAEKAALKVQKRVLRHTAEELQVARRIVRQQRQQEDAAWREMRTARKQQHVEQTGQPAAERKAQAAHWRVLRQQRRATRSHRKQADTEWRQKRNSIRAQWSQLPIITAWMAILVVTDNCTRQCLGRPLSVVGSKVTAEMVVAALRVLLPQELQFLISDRGIHFTATVFQELARSEEFIHILIARQQFPELDSSAPDGTENG